MVERLEVEIRRLAFAADDGVEGLVGTDRRAFPGDVGDAHQQVVERGLLRGKAGLDLADLGADRLGALAERRAFVGRSALEAVADLVALATQLLDPGLQLAHLAVEREQGVEIERHAFVGDRLADEVDMVADEGQAEHQARLAAEARSAKPAAAPARRCG